MTPLRVLSRLGLVALAPVALAACALLPPVRFAIDDVNLPVTDSRGQICYTEIPVRGQTPVNPGLVTYRADATYRASTLPTLPQNDIRVRVYGRDTAPGAACVPLSDDDIVLSEEYTLSLNQTQRIEIGGSASDGALASFVRQPRFWLGVVLTGGNLLSAQERIELRQGEVEARL